MEEVGVIIYLYTLIKQLNNNNTCIPIVRKKPEETNENITLKITLHLHQTKEVAYNYNYTKKENIYTDNVSITYIKEAICFPNIVRFSSRGAALIASGTFGNMYWVQKTRNNFLDSKTSFRAICVF